MRLGGFLPASVTGLLFALPASALTISNEDPDPHTITVTAGTDTKQLTVEPDQQVDAVCAAGCMLELENGEQYQMQGGETVSIEDGVIFVDAAPGSDPDDGDDTDDSSDNSGNDAAPPAAGSESTGATPPADAAPPADKPADAQ
jgi:hypothetical protein